MVPWYTKERPFDVFLSTHPSPQKPSGAKVLEALQKFQTSNRRILDRLDGHSKSSNQNYESLCFGCLVAPFLYNAQGSTAVSTPFLLFATYACARLADYIWAFCPSFAQNQWMGILHCPSSDKSFIRSLMDPNFQFSGLATAILPQTN